MMQQAQRCPAARSNCLQKSEVLATTPKSNVFGRP
jgi:predicted nucleic-acid-binding Zn-ribbon protein